MFVVESSIVLNDREALALWRVVRSLNYAGARISVSEEDLFSRAEMNSLEVKLHATMDRVERLRKRVEKDGRANQGHDSAVDDVAGQTTGRGGRTGSTDSGEEGQRQEARQDDKVGG